MVMHVRRNRKQVGAFHTHTDSHMWHPLLTCTRCHHTSYLLTPILPVGGIIHGEATPDLLFESPITINGQEVFWIDAKDYFGTSLPGVQTKSMLKQVERYRTSFGPGALVFSLGCAEDIRPFAWNCGAIVLAEEDLIDCLS